MPTRHTRRSLAAVAIAAAISLTALPAHAEHHACGRVHEEPVPYALPFYGFPDDCGNWGSIGFYPQQGFAAYNHDAAMPLWYYPRAWEQTDYYLSERNSPFGGLGPMSELEFYYSD